MPTFDTATAARMLETAECAVRAFGIVRAQRAMIATLRKNPGPAGASATAAGCLKYADDQTVVSLAAVLQAIRDGGLEPGTFTDWGVVAGPCFLGRETFAAAFKRFPRQGALGVSPLLIPYLSQHAVAGTISLSLRIHGPNLGVGGDKGSLVQALLTGLTLEREHRLPGVWVVLSEWEPEPVTIADGGWRIAASEPGPEIRQRNEAVCRAAALALVPVPADWQGLVLQVRSQAQAQVVSNATLSGLTQFLDQSGLDYPRTWSCGLPWNACLELTRHTATMARAA